MKGAIGDDGGGRGVERHEKRGRGERIAEKETFYGRAQLNLFS